MTTEMETEPATVAAKPQQAGETHDRWWWVQRTVWTERMLTRLAQSEPITVWFRLWDKVFDKSNLQHAYWAVYRNQGAPGVDGQTVMQFDAQEELELQRLGQELRSGNYRPIPARRKWIAKPGTREKRPLGIPAVRDRVVQAAMRNVLEPIFENDFAAHSYGFRPGRGCEQAVKQVEKLLAEGNLWCVDADLKGYFDTIPHERLMERLRQRVQDGSVLALVEKFLKAGVMEDMKEWQPSERGTPQGGVISPLLSNVYLNPLDHEMAGRGWRMVRYADDFVVMCQSREEAETVKEYLRQWTEAEGLTLHPDKTRIVHAIEEGFEFLGWKFKCGRKWPRKKSVQKLRERLKPWTRRKVGESLGAIVARINPTLKGWHAYFKSSLSSGLREQDQWLRRRLRAMLRKREKRPGFGTNKRDHRQWPNRWFAEQKLFSLEHGSCNYG